MSVYDAVVLRSIKRNMSRVKNKKLPTIAGHKLLYECNLRCKMCPFWRRPDSKLLSMEQEIAIKDFEREDLFIISKVWPVNLHYKDVINSAKESLKRLDTDYIDLYLIHWPNPKIPVKETLDAMGELLDSHLIRNIGVSNFDIANLTEAIDQLKHGKIIANEVEYNLENYYIEDDLIPFCEKNNIKIIGYSPLNQGRISSKINHVAKSLGMSSIQCTLGYLKKKSIPIPKASSISHINELVECMNIDLDENEYNRIKEAVRR